MNDSLFPEEIWRRIKEYIGLTPKSTMGEIWAIKELALNPPQDNLQTLRTDYVRGLDPDRTIKLEEVMRRVGLTA